MDNTPWYQYSEKDKIKNVYGKYTITDFWNWWQGDDRKVMEIRIKDYQLIKSIAKEYNLKYSSSGIYVWNVSQLRLVIAKVRDKATMWCGVNSRKQNWNKWGSKGYGGLDTNVLQIDNLFIDIDRVNKEGAATNVELENCDRLANLILERLGKQKWNCRYIKICSGNGVQLLISLDIPIKLPEVEFDNKSKAFTTNREYEVAKSIIREGIGKDLVTFCSKYKKDLGVEVDRSCFNIGRVCALPFTKNYKHGGYTWRGVVELKDGVNEGFSDYIWSKEEDITVYEERNVFVTRGIKRRDYIKEGELEKNRLIRFMLDNNLPEGMRNNYLWFQIKCLLRDSKYDVTSDEFRKVHSLLEKKYGSLPTNFPDKKFIFDENIVNSYCIINGIIPLYPLWPTKTKKLDMLLDDISWEFIMRYPIDARKVGDGDKIIDDMKEFKKELREGNLENKEKFISFVKGVIIKYGEKKAKFFFGNIMLRYLSYE